MNAPMTEREQIVRAYIRVCRDSRFQMQPEKAAQLVARILGIGSALAVWARSGLTLGDMLDIAEGTHPALANPHCATATYAPNPTGPALLEALRSSLNTTSEQS